MRIGSRRRRGRHGVSATEMSGCLCCPWLGKAPPDEADGAPCVKGASDALQAPARASPHQRDELGTLVGVTLISRHGARLPNKGELRPFVDGSAVRREWTQRGAEMLSGESSLASTNMGDVSASERIDPSQRDPSQRGSTTPLENNLTDVGRQQMRTLGRWLVAHPKYGALLRSREPRLEWRSSAAPRVMESGRLIGEGVASALGSGAAAFPHTPVTYTPDDVFRAWDREVSASLSPEYRAHVRAMSEAAEFVARAEEVQGELKAIYEKVGLPPRRPSTPRGPRTAPCRPCHRSIRRPHRPRLHPAVRVRRRHPRRASALVHVPPPSLGVRGILEPKRPRRGGSKRAVARQRRRRPAAHAHCAL